MAAPSRPRPGQGGGTVYLILAHQFPRQLARLIRALVEDPQARCLIHLDARVSETAPWEDALQGLPRWGWTPRRIAVHWAGFSMVEASLILLNNARYQQSFHRYVLLSGTCYPVGTAAMRARQLEGDANFLDARPVPPGHPAAERLLARIQRWWLMDHDWVWQARDPAQSEQVQALRSYLGRFREQLPPPPPLPLPYHHGSQWWALTDAAVAWLLAELRTQAGQSLIERFRYSFCPDEAFFQTLLAASPLAASLKPSLHLVDWSEASRAQGKWLDESHWRAIRQSGALFVRKVHPQHSAALLDRLDRLSASDRA